MKRGRETAASCLSARATITVRQRQVIIGDGGNLSSPRARHGTARHGRAVSAVAAATVGTAAADAAAAAATDDVRRAERSRLKTSLSTAQDSAAFDAGVTQQTDAVAISPTRDLHPDTHSCEIKFSRSFQTTNHYCDNIVFII